MNEIVTKIADCIIAQKPLPIHGLITGNAGICMFFYHLAKATGDKKYEDYADELLDTIYNEKKIREIPDFGNGYAGFGWMLEYLIQNGFCDGSDDSIFDDIDTGAFKTLHEKLTPDIDLNTGLTGYLMFLTSRLQGKRDVLSDNALINTELYTTFALFR
jgi:lantibiotic modifying enzyme